MRVSPEVQVAANEAPLGNDELLRARLQRAEARAEELEKRVEDYARQVFFEAQKLRHISHQLQDLLDNIPAAILVTDDDLSFEHLNAKVESILGIPRSELRGRLFLDLLLQTGFSSETGITDNSQLEGYEAEVLYKHPAKSVKVPLSLTISALRTPEGDFQGYILVFTDIQKRKDLERQLLQSQKMESVGQLTAGLAHELNTPIQYVRDNTVFIRDQFRALAPLLAHLKATPALPTELASTLSGVDLPFLADEIPLALDQTLEGAESVAKIVKSMKVFSHPGNESRTDVNLNEALETVVTISKNEWKYCATMDLELDASLPEIHCMPQEINQALLNIVVNAAHAIQEKGKERGNISIKTGTQDGRVLISISDSGTGIKEENKSKIFDPFFTTKEVGKGTGQGLTFVYDVIVNKHKGKIDIDTEIGVGTTFKISLPLK
jgi:PAS domain S-box-containing protein